MSNEYIERETLQGKTKRRLDCCNPNTICQACYEVCLQEIEDMPIADVEEVVRCVSCIHLDKKGICTKFRQRYPFYPEGDFYCGFGAKKDTDKGE